MRYRVLPPRGTLIPFVTFPTVRRAWDCVGGCLGLTFEQMLKAGYKVVPA
jgi:hypothetical protein